MKRALLLTLILLIALTLAAQVRGPVSGIVYDSHERVLRPIVGFPGAAYLGLAMTGAVDAAAASPDSRLAVIAEGGALYLVRALDTDQPASVALPNGTGIAERIAWSQDSSAVAVQAGGQVLLYTALNETVAAGSAAHTRAATGTRPGAKWIPALTEIGIGEIGQVTALAVGDGASVLVGAEGGLYRLASDGGRTLLAEAGAVSGISIAGERLYFTDRARSEVLEIGNWRDAADVTLFANQSQGVDDPVGVALAADGRSVWVAGGRSKSLTLFDTASRGMVSRVELGFEPTRLSPAGDGSVLLLNERGSETEALQVLEDGPDARVYFIPAANAAQLAAVNSVEE